MSLVFLVYLIGIVPNITNAATFIISSYFVVIATLFILTPIWWDDYKEEVAKQFRRYLWLPVIASVVFVVLPSEKTMYYMVAVYGAEKIAETPAAQQLGNDALDVLKGLVAKAKKELADESVKEKK